MPLSRSEIVFTSAGVPGRVVRYSVQAIGRGLALEHNRDQPSFPGVHDRPLSYDASMCGVEHQLCRARELDDSLLLRRNRILPARVLDNIRASFFERHSAGDRPSIVRLPSCDHAFLSELRPCVRRFPLPLGAPAPGRTAYILLLRCFTPCCVNS